MEQAAIVFRLLRRLEAGFLAKTSSLTDTFVVGSICNNFFESNSYLIGALVGDADSSNEVCGKKACSALQPCRSCSIQKSHLNSPISLESLLSNR